MFARNCDLAADACSISKCERRSSSFWRVSSAVASRTFCSSSLEARLSCSYRRARSNSSVRSCRMVTMAVTSPCSDTILPEMASTGRGAPVRGSTSPMDPLRRIAPGSKKRFDTKEEKCASLACTVRLASLDGAPGEGRGEEHVVERDGAAPALAFVLARREQRLGARVGDGDAALGVGQEDGVRHRVDDVVEQRSLAENAPLALLPALGGPQRGEARAEQARDPLRLGLDIRVARRDE